MSRKQYLSFKSLSPPAESEPEKRAAKLLHASCGMCLHGFAWCLWRLQPLAPCNHDKDEHSNAKRLSYKSFWPHTHTHTHLYRIMTPRLFTEALSFLLNLFKQRTPWWHHSLQLPEDSFVCPKYVASSKGHNSNPQQNRLRFNEPQKFDAMAEMAQRWMERSSTVFLHRRGKKATESSAEDVLSLLAPQATLQLQLMIW